MRCLTDLLILCCFGFKKNSLCEKAKDRDKKIAQILIQKITFLEAGHNATRGSDARPRTRFLIAPAEGTSQEFKPTLSEQTNYHILQICDKPKRTKQF